MDGRFLTAFIVPEKWDIMGYKLRPFSLRHMLYLEAIESPMFTGKGPVTSTPEDLLVFLRVCSSVHPSEAFRKPSIADRWNIARMTISSEYLYTQISKCVDYMHTCSSVPRVYRKEDGTSTKKENIPGPLSIATGLMSRIGFSKDEAWDCTIGQGIWYLTAYAESEGVDVKILTTQDEAKADSEREELERFQNEVLAKIKGNKR